MAKKIKTKITIPKVGKFYFDAVFSTEHKYTVTVTKHPVQDGASISDHAIIEPDEVMLDIGMSDTMKRSGTNHSVNAFKTLKSVMELRTPVKLTTRLNAYTDMVITSISTVDDYKTMNGLRASIIFTKVNTVKVHTVKVKQTVDGSKGGGGGGKGGGGDGKREPQETEDPEKKSILTQLTGQ